MIHSSRVVTEEIQKEASIADSEGLRVVSMSNPILVASREGNNEAAQDDKENVSKRRQIWRELVLFECPPPIPCTKCHPVRISDVKFHPLQWASLQGSHGVGRWKDGNCQGVQKGGLAPFD